MDAYVQGGGRSEHGCGPRAATLADRRRTRHAGLRRLHGPIQQTCLPGRAAGACTCTHVVWTSQQYGCGLPAHWPLPPHPPPRPSAPAGAVAPATKQPDLRRVVAHIVGGLHSRQTSCWRPCGRCCCCSCSCRFRWRRKKRSSTVRLLPLGGRFGGRRLASAAAAAAGRRGLRLDLHSHLQPWPPVACVGVSSPVGLAACLPPSRSPVRNHYRSSRACAPVPPRPDTTRPTARGAAARPAGPAGQPR